MASLKKLAGQTVWYGVSAIFARFLNYLLTPFLTHYLTAAIYGEMSIIYAAIPFLNVVFTWGMETAFFRFSNKGADEKTVFDTGSLSLLFTTLLFAGMMYVWRLPIAVFLKLEDHPEFITWAILIIALDALTTLPFAKLRNDGKPRKYAFVRIFGIVVNIGLVVFFYALLPKLAIHHPYSVFAKIYNPNMGAGYVIIANVAQSAISFILLMPEFFSIRFKWSGVLLKEMVIYSLPIMVAGFAGMINETFDRVMLEWWWPGTALDQKIQVGIYSACYKLSLLITLFVQAFRLGAEPFFFQQAKGEDAPKTYARVMKFFVITICTMFLFVMLYIDVWKYFITNPKMWVGLKVVPILLIANMSLGVYYNLSIWYKLAHRTTAGATITVIGAAITLAINYLFIPRFSYMACAWATMICYTSMMIVSYFWGQKVYPVPYNTKKLLGYFGLALLLYFAYNGIIMLTPKVWLHLLLGTVLLAIYVRFIIKVEGKELRNLPFIGKLVR